MTPKQKNNSVFCSPKKKKKNETTYRNSRHILNYYHKNEQNVYIDSVQIEHMLCELELSLRRKKPNVM